jgi:hypothetical protein
MCTHSAETNSVLLEIGTFVQTKKLWNLDELQLRYLGVEENALTLIFFENDNFAFGITYNSVMSTISNFPDLILYYMQQHNITQKIIAPPKEEESNSIQSDII